MVVGWVGTLKILGFSTYVLCKLARRALYLVGRVPKLTLTKRKSRWAS